MDSQKVFHTTAGMGNLSKLKEILLKKTESEIRLIVSSITNGTTPLIMSCKYGHLDVVNYLVETCGADVMQEGNDDTQYEIKVTPLWYAAKYGNLTICEALLNSKANVNISSNQNVCSSPLFAALCGYDYQIVDLLFNNGADVNARGNDGHTLLHLAAERNITHLAEVLLHYGAQSFENDFGLTPLLLASKEGNTEIVNFFLRKLNLSKLQIIHAMELLGAIKIDCENGLITAFNYWKKATILRYRDSKYPISKQINRNSPIGAEFDNLDQLNDMVSDIGAMKIQSLLIKVRILGLRHEDIIEHILETGRFFNKQEDVQLGTRLFIYAVDSLQSLEQPKDLSVGIISQVCGRFYAMVLGNIALSSQDVFWAFRISATILEVSSKRGDFADIDSMTLLLHFIGLLYHLIENEDGKENIIESICKVLKLNYRNEHGDSLLHLACSGCNLSLDEYLDGTKFFFPSFSVLTVLLDAGMSTISKNKLGDTPLHKIARNDRCNFKIVKLLLKHGANLDALNDSNETPRHLLKNKPFSKCFL